MKSLVSNIRDYFNRRTKVVDSQTNELLTTSATEIGGDKFRLQSSESGEFKKIAKTWVQDAIKYAFKNQANND